MKTPFYRLTAALLSLAFLQLACYSKYSITTAELARLESGNMAEVVTVQSANGPVDILATTPIEVVARSGTYSVTPFNFTLTDTQLVAPDYDLLLRRQDIEGANVSEFRKGRTIGLIVGSILAAGGAFALISILAGDEEQ
jgi:hypothetical protein